MLIYVQRSADPSTNTSGFYVKGQILPGRYEVKAELRGFKSKVVSSVVVSVDT